MRRVYVQLVPQLLVLRFAALLRRLVLRAAFTFLLLFLSFPRRLQHHQPVQLLHLRRVQRLAFTTCLLSAQSFCLILLLLPALVHELEPLHVRVFEKPLVHRSHIFELPRPPIYLSQQPQKRDQQSQLLVVLVLCVAQDVDRIQRLENERVARVLAYQPTHTSISIISDISRFI